jgi:hypothetical protein
LANRAVTPPEVARKPAIGSSRSVVGRFRPQAARAQVS